MHVIFDIDEVLYPFLSSAVVMMNTLSRKERGDRHVEISLEDFSSYSIGKELGQVSPELATVFAEKGGFYWVLRQLGNDPLFVEREPYPDAARLLRRLYAAGATVSIVTSRAEQDDDHRFYDDAVIKTRAWLANHGLPYHYLLFSGDKLAMARQLEQEAGSITFAVEDHPRHAYHYSGMGIPVFVPARVYNEKLNLLDSWKIPSEEWDAVLDSGMVVRFRHADDILVLLRQPHIQERLLARGAREEVLHRLLRLSRRVV